MPRRNRHRRDQRSLSGSAGWARSEQDGDGEEWLVRPVPGAQATKVYRCPGCDHEIQPGVPHVVAWPAGETGTVTDRRHWHSGCWQARERRRPTRRR